MAFSIKDVQFIVLSAGKSKRMRSDDPKALAKLNGKYFLAHVLDTVKSLSPTIKPIIIVGHKKERIFEIFGTEHSSLDHIYAEQTEQLGTGHAVLCGKEKTDKNAKTIFIISTDQPLISKETILNILEHHAQNQAVITLGTIKLPDFSEWRAGMLNFGRIIRDKEGKVVRSVEFKDATEDEKKITEVNPAMYAFDAKWLWENIENIKNENASGEYYLTDLISLAVNQGKNIEALPIKNMLEGLQPNSPEELVVLESLLV